jgi:hypothetical protein
MPKKPTAKSLARRPEPKMMRPLGLPPIDPIQRYDIREIGAYLRTSRASIYKLVRAEKASPGSGLTLSKMGKRSYAKGTELIRYLRQS